MNSFMRCRGQDDVRTFFEDAEEEIEIPAYEIPV
jgi:hypothetical protein